MMRGTTCEVGDACGRTYGYEQSLSHEQGETDDYSGSDGVTNTTVMSSSYSLGQRYDAPGSSGISGGIDIAKIAMSAGENIANAIGNVAVGPGGFNLGSILGGLVSLGFSYSNEKKYTTSQARDRSLRRDYARVISRTRGFKSSRGMTYTIKITRSEQWARPSYSTGYCGAWFAVPIMGLDCGRGASGQLDRVPGGLQCSLDSETSSFGQCFEYTFIDPERPKDSRYKAIFVLKDCEEGFVLPGEWQHPAFANSFGVTSFVDHHVARYGLSDASTARFKQLPQDHTLYHQSKPAYTRTLGPTDEKNYTIEVCGRGKYCARHKLEDNYCYTLPRGWLGEKSAHVVSTKTTPGNCCVLFSRPECYGLPQVVNGSIDNLAAVGYEGLAHSVMCNVDEYCNPRRAEVFGA